jgi:putative transposase
MKKSRTGSFAGEVLASPSVATVQLPLPLLDVLADTHTAFFGLCLDAGQRVLTAMMEHDREQLCGPKNVPDPARPAYRSGSTRGEVTLGGRRVLVPRLRARSVAGAELELPSFAYARGRDPLDARTLEAIAIGVTTRKYRRALDPLPAGTQERAVAQSSASRRFVALTKARVTTWLAQPLDALDVRVVVIDGLHFRDHVIVLALGVDSQGQKHVLALHDGTTENATVCKALLSDLLAVVQRCQVHEARNVLEHLPEAMRPRVRRALAEAYGLTNAALAQRRREQLAAGLDRTHPGAAASLREGLDETLMLQRLGVTGALWPDAGQQEGGRVDAHQPSRRSPAFNSERDIPARGGIRAEVDFSVQCADDADVHGPDPRRDVFAAPSAVTVNAVSPAAARIIIPDPARFVHVPSARLPG